MWSGLTPLVAFLLYTSCTCVRRIPMISLMFHSGDILQKHWLAFLHLTDKALNFFSEKSEKIYVATFTTLLVPCRTAVWGGVSLAFRLIGQPT